MKKFLAALLVACAPLASLAQPSQALQQGQDFAKQIQPTSATQILNPAGIGWTSPSTMPTSVPSGLGAFSSPASGNAVLQDAQGMGLLQLGNTALDRCANWRATGDPVKDQECAGVNFLAKRCFTPSDAQGKIMGINGSGGVPAGCEGTFGAGQAKFNYANTITSKDSVFASVTTAQAAAANDPANQVCAVQTVTTTPAQFATYVGIKSTDIAQTNCSQYLGATVTAQDVPATISGYTCPTGATLVGTNCQTTTTIPATPVYSCPAGWELSGTICSQTLTNAATPVYTCPTGWSVSGANCIQTQTQGATVASYACPAGWSVTGSNCQQTNTQSAAPNYSCPAGSTLNGSNCTTPNNVITPATISSYSCPAGWNVSGSNCTQTVTTSATPVYTCASGWNLSGSSCTRTASQSATIASYSCPAGWTVSGSNCVQTNTQNATIASYSCPSGWTVNRSNCSQINTQPGQSVYRTCADGSAPVNGICNVKTVTTSWVDACKPYADSAGITLTPQ